MQQHSISILKYSSLMQHNLLGLQSTEAIITERLREIGMGGAKPVLELNSPVVGCTAANRSRGPNLYLPKFTKGHNMDQQKTVLEHDN